MRYRVLGRSNLVVSEVGFGGWAIGGQWWGPVDDETSIAAIRAAVEAGVSFIDTADVYGDGHSEELIGRALDGQRDRVVIATKAGLQSPTGSNYDSEYIAGAVDLALGRFGTDYIDLFQLHNPPKKVLADEALWERLRDLKQAGKIRAYGASVQSPADGFIAIEKGGVDAVQVVFNVADQSARPFLEAARQAGVGVIGRVPLGSGFLSGKYDAKHYFKPGDFRRGWSAKRRDDYLARADALTPVADALGATRAQAAIAFVLSYDAVSVTIPGVKTPAQAAENAAASDFAPLAPEHLSTLEATYKVSKNEV